MKIKPEYASPNTCGYVWSHGKSDTNITKPSENWQLNADLAVKGP